MKQKHCTLLFILFCFLGNKTFSQFYNYFSSSLLEAESAATEINNGFVFGYTETGPPKKYHENILLVKTNTDGNIKWCKRYDAGTGLSLHLIEMITTFNNDILISCIYGPDNSYKKTARGLLLINAAGEIVWAKKYSPLHPFDNTGLVQLKDSSFVFSLKIDDHNPAVVHVNNAGHVLSAEQITNRNFESIHGITAINNSANVIVGDKNIVNINFETGVKSAQKQYNTSGQFTCLLSSVCKNGDLIFLAGRNYGGLISGDSRVFRTKPNGDLLWAKNIDAFFDRSNSVFSRFDIVTQSSIHEDVHGNIVAIMQEESTQNLMVVFNSKGKYLYHILPAGSRSFLQETQNGNYLQTAASINNMFGKVILANRAISNASTCDSTIFVDVTNGTDSSTTLDRLAFTNANIITRNISVSVSDTVIQTNIFCYVFSGSKNANIANEFTVSVNPNPATNTIIIKTASKLPVNIYDLSGILKMRSFTNQSINISLLKPGVYMATIIDGDQVIKKTLIKK